jgi:hypothetical protein
VHYTKDSSGRRIDLGTNSAPFEVDIPLRAFPRNANRLNALLIKQTHNLHSSTERLQFHQTHNGAPIEFLSAMIWSRDPASKAMTCSLVKAKTVCMSCS